MIIVYEIEAITPGARHYWLRTDKGRIRKPIGSKDLEQYDFSNLQDDKIILIESRLLHWGNWLVRATIGGLGYPSKSTIVTALQGRGCATVQHSPDDPEAEEVEAAVKKLEREIKRHAEALRAHYTRALDVPATNVAKSLEIAESTYFRYLNAARKRIKEILKGR